jgi:hypothetical protein
VEDLHRQLERSGLHVVKKHDISPNIMKALDLDSDRKHFSKDHG